MKRFATLALAAVALTFSTLTASAQPVTWNVDNSHSSVHFKVRHFLTTVTGQFNDFEGTIVFDEKNPAALSVVASVRCSTVFTDHERRDGHLRSADFFDVEKFPTITFKSTKAEAVGKNKFKITGDFTMRGVTKVVTFDGEFMGAGTFGSADRSMTKAGFSASAVIQRKDYGMVWNRTFDQGGVMLGEDVTISIEVEADKAK